MRNLLLYLFLLSSTATIIRAQDIAAQISDALTKYDQKVLQEKIFVHTDRSFYMTGESMMFKLYVTDANSNAPLDLSKVGYVELIRNGQAVLQAKISLAHGTGHGSLFLPASINSGNYVMRAYTQWMRNFDPSFYFSRTITIVNPFKPLEPVSAVNNSTPMYDAQFFPEGGNMLSDVPCKMAFRVVDRSGKGISFRGTLMDGQDTVVNFMPHKFGIGHFTFTPTAGKRYTVILMDTLNRPILKKDLSEPDENGYAMRLSDEGQNRLRIDVSVRQPSSDVQAVYLVAHTRGSVKLKDSRLVQGGTASFLIDKSSLGDGISHFTIFDRNRKPVCERLYFKLPQRVLSISGSLLRENYSTRKKVSLDLQVTAEASTHADGDLSISVYRVDSLQLPDASTIDSHLLLASDLQGAVESPSFYFQDTPEARAAADNLMLTHGWRRFKWNQVLSDSLDIKYIPEHHSQIIHGKLTETTTGKPAVGIIAYMAIPGKQFHLAGSRSDREGNVFFAARNFQGTGKIVVQTNFEKDSVYKIEVTSPFADPPQNAALPELVLPENLQAQLIRRSVSMQLQNVFMQNLRLAPALVDSVAFHGKPEEQYFLDDYTRFPVMEEVMREYVRAVLVRKRKGGFHFMVYDRTTDRIFKEDPMVLLDGVPVFDVDKIMNYDPLKVERLDVVTSRYFYGPLTFYGIVSYKTYKGDLDGFELDPRALVMNYEGLQVKKEFFSPVYETPEQTEAPLPDFRDLLFWKPDITTDKDGKCSIEFYTSDQTGKYIAVVHGLSRDGQAGTWTTSFDVVPPENN